MGKGQYVHVDSHAYAAPCIAMPILMLILMPILMPVFSSGKVRDGEGGLH